MTGSAIFTCLSIDSLCNWIPGRKNQAMKGIQQLHVCTIEGMSYYSQENLDRIPNLMLQLLLLIQEVSGSNRFVGWP
jgi:hypothetical protein